MKNADKPINPIVQEENIGQGGKILMCTEYGLTKREHYAGLAMQGLLANPQYWKRVYKDISTLKSDKDSIECVFAHYSIKIAEELLEQLEGK